LGFVGGNEEERVLKSIEKKVERALGGVGGEAKVKFVRKYPFRCIISCLFCLLYPVFFVSGVSAVR
jgi:hypothetical protein